MDVRCPLLPLIAPSTYRAVPGGVLSSAGRPGVTGRFVSETIVVMSVLVVYHGSANLSVLDVVAIVLGLPIAIAIGHMLAWTLSDEAALGRRPTRGELLSTVTASRGSCWSPRRRSSCSLCCRWPG